MTFCEKFYLFRVDFSPEIGGGHFSRCALLLKQLQLNFCNSAFVCKDTDSARNFSLPGLENLKKYFIADAEDEISDATSFSEIIEYYSEYQVCVILDSYELGTLWVSKIKKLAYKIAVIDDLCNCFLDCDLIISQSFFATPFDYRDRSPLDCKVLSGPSYLIVRPEFRIHQIVNYPLPSYKPISSIHLMAGAGNSATVIQNIFIPLIHSHDSFQFILNIPAEIDHVIMHTLINTPNLELKVNSQCIAKDMSDCQLAIGTPGVSTWERACIGIPSIQFGTCTNKIAMDSQDLVMRKLDQLNICFWLGQFNSTSSAKITNKLNSILKSPNVLQIMHESCTKLIDGNGLFRVTSELLKL